MLSRCLAAYLYHNNIYAEWEAKYFCSTRLIFGSDDITMSIEILGVGQGPTTHRMGLG